MKTPSLKSQSFKHLIPIMLLSAAGLWRVFAADTPAPDPSTLKYGLYIHYGMPTFAKPGEHGEIPANRFNPTSVNIKSWPHAAKEAGMTFAVLTVKHESGFCLWSSEGYDYDVSGSSFKGDIIGDFISACNEEGILPGVHYSIPDAHNEGAVRFQGPVPNLYFNLIKKQTTELHTKYPGIRVEVFDDVWRFSTPQFEEISAIVKRLNPGCVILDQRKPPRGPVYSYATIPKGWMWRANQPLNAAGQLFQAYEQARAANQSFLLNVGPDPGGNIPPNQLAVLTQMKAMIANPAVASSPSPDAKADPAARLKKLKALYDDGLITKDDYDKKVKEIMDSL
jgi:alpha-L-fucosidase